MPFNSPAVRRSLKAIVSALVLICAWSPSTVHAQQSAAAPAVDAVGFQGDFIMRDFRFSGGGVLPELRIHYTTLGRPRRDAAGIVRNAVLVLHGYTAPPRGLETALTILFMMSSSPLQLQRAAPTRDSADAYIAAFMRTRMGTTDANDFLYQFEASRDYDPSLHLERIRAPLLAINSADDLVNPPELLLMERLMPRVRRGRYVLIPTSERTRGHGTHSVPALWKQDLVRLLAEMKKK